MKILQISAISDPNWQIFGLGEDNKIYRWIWEKGAWIPNWRQDDKT